MELGVQGEGVNLVWQAFGKLLEEGELPSNQGWVFHGWWSKGQVLVWC